MTAAVAALLVTSAAGVARAQLRQTWISGVGDDANPCSRFAPCLTLQGSYGKTAVGGEINYLDPVEAGPLIIDHSITVNGKAAGGGIQVAGQDGIVVAAGNGDTVVLRHLSLSGDNTQTGVQVTSVGVLQVEACAVRNFGNGVDFEPSAGGKLIVSESTLEQLGGSALVVGSQQGRAVVTVTDSSLGDSARGVQALAGAQVTVFESALSNNSIAGAVATLGQSGGASEINLYEATLNGNGVGVSSDALAGSAVVRLANVTTNDNSQGPTHVSGVGTITSFGGNSLDTSSTLIVDSWAPAQRVPSGTSSFYPVTIGVSGLTTQPINLSCVGLPAGATCQFTPSTLPAEAAMSEVSLIVTTGPVMSMREQRPHQVLAWLALLPLLALAGVRRRRWSGLLALTLGFSLTVAACGGQTSTTEPDMATAPSHHADFGPDEPFVARDFSTTQRDLSTSPDLATPAGHVAPGTYTFQVIATSGSLTAQKTLTLTVD